MKTNLVKFYITTFFLCCTVVTFAQPAIPDESDGDTTPAAPIDDYIWLLAVIGLLFIFLKFRASYQQAANSQE
jgi:hypothetical protein